jgi:hypothetical protein
MIDRVNAPAPTLLTRRGRIATLVFACALTLSMAVANVQADSYDERRVRAGARLFRSMLAADTGLERRRDADGSLHVLLYASDARLGGEIGALIAPADASKARVRGMPVTVLASAQLPDSGSGAANAGQPAGVFLASIPSDAELDRLIAWSIAHGVIVYSPFEGHVERGVAGGITIEAKVQPYVNLATLKASGVELKPFFLKVAKVHR